MTVTSPHNGPFDWTPRDQPLGAPAAPVPPPAEPYAPPVSPTQGYYPPASPPPAYYQQPQPVYYQQPPIVYVQPIPRASTATAALIFGLAGLFFWCLLGLPNIMAVILGHLAFREIKQAGVDPMSGQDRLRGRLFAGWALVLGYPMAVVGVLTAVNYLVEAITGSPLFS